MRCLLLNQFYPPDIAPTGQFLHDLARAIVERGHQVEVVCSRRSYEGNGTRYAPRETLDGVDIRRVAATGWGHRSVGRVADYASFLGLALGEALQARPRPDLVLSLTTPPYVGLVPWVASALRGIAHAHWVMDVYPDVMVAHGMLAEGGLPARALRALTRRQLAGAALVLSLGPRMHERLRRYVDAGTRTAWVPLWSDGTQGAAPEEAVAAVRAERGWGKDELVFLYSGNMGLGHRLGEFLEAARRLGEAGPRWVFVGGGPRRQEVEAFVRAHPEARVELLPYVARERLRESLSSGDVHLVSVGAAWRDLMFPSKIAAAFSVGRPVIFVGPRESDAAAWIEEAGGGWVVSEGDLDGLLRAVAEASDPQERARRGAAALAFGRERFDGPANCERIAALLEECVPRAG